MSSKNPMSPFYDDGEPPKRRPMFNTVDLDNFVPFVRKAAGVDQTPPPWLADQIASKGNRWQPVPGGIPDDAPPRTTPAKRAFPHLRGDVLVKALQNMLADPVGRAEIESLIRDAARVDYLALARLMLMRGGNR
jgi:hypothetical protein